MTSNRPIQDWGKLIGDVPSATAILDRFLHHAEVIAISGRSYRLRNKAQSDSAPTDSDAVEDPNAANPPAGSVTFVAHSRLAERNKSAGAPSIIWLANPLEGPGFTLIAALDCLPNSIASPSTSSFVLAAAETKTSLDSVA
jgi:hypothetical protein